MQCVIVLHAVGHQHDMGIHVVCKVFVPLCLESAGLFMRCLFTRTLTAQYSSSCCQGAFQQSLFMC